jgi:CheY-like chemotaxis protein
MDKLRLNQIFFNLLSNASKYSPAGSKIICRILEEKLPGKKLRDRIDIIDQGIGMSEEFQKVLFKPFSQELRNTESKGTGLGLSIAKKLVEQMRGTISVQSTLNRGSTFSLNMIFDYIPSVPAAKTAAVPQPSLDNTLLRGKRVLLCEDHPLNREIAATLLKQKGMLVETAVDGGEAVAKFNKSNPGYYDLILMDNRMPVMFGYEAAAKIRALARVDAKTVPIIAMTADAFSEDVQRALDSGMNAHLAKPLDPQRMFATIVKVLQK